MADKVDKDSGTESSNSEENFGKIQDVSDKDSRKESSSEGTSKRKKNSPNESTAKKVKKMPYDQPAIKIFKNQMRGLKRKRDQNPEYQHPPCKKKISEAEYQFCKASTSSDIDGSSCKQLYRNKVPSSDSDDSSLEQFHSLSSESDDSLNAQQCRLSTNSDDSFARLFCSSSDSDDSLHAIYFLTLSEILSPNSSKTDKPVDQLDELEPAQHQAEDTASLFAKLDVLPESDTVHLDHHPVDITPLPSEAGGAAVNNPQGEKQIEQEDTQVREMVMWQSSIEKKER